MRGFMEQLAGIARKSGVDPNIVHWSGATKVEETHDDEDKKPKLKLVKSCC
jgi:hypothetical protein